MILCWMNLGRKNEDREWVDAGKDHGMLDDQNDWPGWDHEMKNGLTNGFWYHGRRCDHDWMNVHESGHDWEVSSYVGRARDSLGQYARSTYSLD